MNTVIIIQNGIEVGKIINFSNYGITKCGAVETFLPYIYKKTREEINDMKEPKIWAFAWDMGNEQYDIRPIIDTNKKRLIKEMEDVFSRPWSEIRKEGGIIIRCIIKKKKSRNNREISKSQVFKKTINFKKCDKKTKQILLKTIDEMELSARVYTSLRHKDIENIGELIQLTKKEMLKMRNFYKKSLIELIEILAAEKLNFGITVLNFPKRDKLI